MAGGGVQGCGTSLSSSSRVGGGVQEELEGSHVSGALEVDLNLLWDNFQSFLLILIISVSLRKSIY